MTTKLLLIMALMITTSFVFAKTIVNDNAKFGAKDARGAFQEARIKKFKVNMQYFTQYERLGLKHNKQIQIDSNIFPDRDTNIRHNFWGRYGEIYFQDGQIKTLSEKSNTFPKLNGKKDYCFVRAVISYDSLSDLEKDAFYNDGVITLVSGQSNYGPINSDGSLGAGFSQSVELRFQGTGVYNQYIGMPINQFGNAKDDDGRVISITCVSFSRDSITVGAIRNSMGTFAEIVYP